MIELDPGNILAWIIVGMLAGWIAGLITRGAGFGCIGNIVVGLVGAFLGALILAFIAGNEEVDFLGSVAVATFGAVVLLAIANLARR